MDSAIKDIVVSAKLDILERPVSNVRNRGYYMATRRYEIFLRVLKIFHSFAALTREEKFRISKRTCNVLFII